ncbi:uncharacterized protein K441DRAFT_519142, partial [Cenococcum geophilum 1.58]|uniref:uncharacterized protein n=1 Tax=Cenococcum geophilum 1.58 TaxID=794803 RepID=UPI00358E90FE
GKYKEAEAMHRRALKRCKKVLRLEYLDTLTSADNLRLGKYKEAKVIYWRALEVGEKVLKREHPSTLTSVSNFRS